MCLCSYPSFKQSVTGNFKNLNMCSTLTITVQQFDCHLNAEISAIAIRPDKVRDIGSAGLPKIPD